MPLTVEYLAIFRRTDSFCDSAAAFTRLIQVNSDIVVNNQTIDFRKMPTCKYELTSGDVAGKDQRYFHLKFSWNGDPDAASTDLRRFLFLLRAVRTVISNTGGEVETLHDDVSTHYACKAYPLIHDIENLMRRLIANFMLLNVGIEWTEEALPSGVEDAIRERPRKPTGEGTLENLRGRDYLNVLYTLDLIHLGNILFDPYSKRTPFDLYIAIKDVKTVADAEALKSFVPQSNWTRYFAQIIKCDDQYLDSRWRKLYALRCKVAHNALMSPQDFADVKRLVSEVRPKLLEALGKLPQVAVPPGDVETVAESAARNINAALGEFVRGWQQLEADIARRMQPPDGTRRPTVIPPSNKLHELGVLDEPNMDVYDEVRRLRNQIVHGPAPDVPLERIQAATGDIRRLIAFVEQESVIAKLKAMNEAERESTVDAIIADSMHEITESDAFCSQAAMTNATWFSVDEYDIEGIEIEGDECVVTLSYGASGEQIEDKAYFGDRITGRAEAVIEWDGDVTYQDVTAEVDHGETEEDEFDPGDLDYGRDEHNEAGADPEEGSRDDDASAQ